MIIFPYVAVYHAINRPSVAVCICRLVQPERPVCLNRVDGGRQFFRPDQLSAAESTGLNLFMRRSEFFTPGMRDLKEHRLIFADRNRKNRLFPVF